MFKIPSLTVLLMLMLFLQNSAYSQGFKVSTSLGYATFNLSEMETLQNQIISNSNLPLKKTDTFPAQPYYQIQLLRETKSKNAIGIFVGFTSTGGRVTASDFSGRVNSDQLLSSYQVGLHTEKIFEKKGILTPFFQAQLSILFSNLKLKDEVIFTNSNNVETTSFTSQNVAIEPTIGIQTNFLPVPFKFGIGYLTNLTDFPLHLRGNKDATIRVNNSEVGANLSGFRFVISSGLGI